MGEVILIASGKGGTGKTVFTANAGVILAQRGFEVLLIDLDLGLRNLDLALGLENKVVYDVRDVCTGVCRISQAIISHKAFPHLHFMAASPSREDGEITPLHMQVLCRKLRKQFDYIIIDGPAGINDGLIVAAAGADLGVVVTLPDYAAIRDADHMDCFLGDLGIRNRCCVVNKAIARLMSQGMVPGIQEISKLMRIPIVGVIQYDENINISSNYGLPIVYKKGTYIYENFSKIVDRIIGS